MSPRIPFNRPYATGREFACIEQAIANLHLSGNGPFSARCSAWLQERTGATRALLTTSCTAALEMSMALAGIGPGDEVIVPSFTFVTTASAIAQRGATAVFVDVREDTLNLDETLVAAAITPRTRAILPVHYGGVGCDMDALCALAAEHGLLVVEDAAQGVLSEYRGRPLGAIGELGCLSFHETKNVICGEGGALLINDAALVERAEILHEKGTNRAQFFRGQVDKYTWVDLGSSYLLSDLNAAYLWPQLERADEITARRMAVWDAYHERLAPLEAQGRLRRPQIPAECRHNAHLYYLLVADLEQRTRVIEHLAADGIQAVFHYVPLHLSPAGLRHGRPSGSLARTESLSERLVRLPLWVGMGDDEVDAVVASVEGALA